MPIKKTNGANGEPSLRTHAASYAHDFGHKILWTLAGILLVYIIILVGTMIRNNLQAYTTIGHADRMERTLTVSGEGKITAKPDIATITLGMEFTKPTVAEAQAENTRRMNDLIDGLKLMNIASEDIQTTNYTIFPQYDYSETGRELEGYTVAQSVTVKIRDLDNANRVIALAGKVGANAVSGLSFTIDDPEVYKAEARKAALKRVAQKAVALKRMLGVDIVGIVSYNEHEGSARPPMPFYAEARGLGGDGAAPQIESGSSDIVVVADVTFEIR